MFIRPFSSLASTDAAVAGGKGASLGEMIQAGLPVPDGFVITADTFERFLEETDLKQEIEAILGTVNTEAIHTVDDASEEIQALILNAEIPTDIRAEIEAAFAGLEAKWVAVRSSATAEDSADHAWAGQLDSFLNTTQDSLLENVRRCFASLFTPRAIFYRFEKGLHTTHISVAVVVQKMVNSEKSGIAFSVHPVTEDYNQLIIEAGFGLGEAIVSGSVTPDGYVVSKEPLEIVDVNVSNQGRALYRKELGGDEWKDLNEKGEEQVLSGQDILELSEIIIKIEKHYLQPMDIEWAYEDGEFFIVQARPITTLKPKDAGGFNGEAGGTKQEYNKEYTRDFSLISQEIWTHSFTDGAVEVIGLASPFQPHSFFNMIEGAVDEWECVQSRQWYKDEILQRNEKDKKFYDQSVKKFLSLKDKCVAHFKNGAVDSIGDLKKTIELIKEAVSYFLVFYYSGVDERTPEDIRKEAIDLRKDDTFFDNFDKYIRYSLVKLHPRLKGLEQAVLLKELENIPSEGILKSRWSNFLFAPPSMEIHQTLEEFAKGNNQYHFAIEKPAADAKALKGQIGFEGMATGKVRILRRKDQISTLAEGEILVSPMTTPDFLPAMKKAAAFVTDEGGIMSHAAIVARELSKPCVIGTKFATQVLKDGDLVEVDADNGIVKIINE